MAKYHVLASKEVKPCKEINCRAKHGSFESKKEADDYALTLKVSKPTSKTRVKEREIIPAIVIPKVEVKTKPVEDEPEIVFENSGISFEDVEEFIAEVGNDDSRDLKASYFEDDEIFLKTRDAVLDEQEASGLFKQDDQTISFEILNFYDDRGRPLSKYVLRRKPPILQLNSSSFEYPIEMVLTENFVRALSKQTSDVYRRYYGLEPKKENSNKLTEVRDWLEANPIKAVTLGIVLIALILLAFIV